MSQIDIDARNLLLERRRALHRHRLPAAVGDERTGASWIDWGTTPERLPEEARRELVEIDAALTRIAEGRYGVCLSCGGPMGLQRLRAIPEARYCLTCSGNHHPSD